VFAVLIPRPSDGASWSKGHLPKDGQGLLGPFEPLSKYLEGEKFVTVTDYLARFAFVAVKVFYDRIMEDENLDPFVKEVKILNAPRFWTSFVGVNA
jgi:hypothetical protein